MSKSNSHSKTKAAKAKNNAFRKRRKSMACATISLMLCHALIYGYMSILVYAAGMVEEESRQESMYHRERVPVNDIYKKLKNKNFRRAYRMNIHSFHKLHHILEPELDKIFFPYEGGPRRNRKLSKYCIDTKTRLSIALRFFAGASCYDLMLTHGVSRTSVYVSIWGVIDAVNRTKRFQIKFPNHAQQKEIASGFKKLSDADFDNVIGAIDGLLVWIIKPPLYWCKKVKCNEGKFKCTRKDKFGMNLQAICDHKLRFTYIDMHWPGSTSDYLAWVTSGLCKKLDCEENNILFEGATLVGDNAYTKKKYMAVPLKGQQAGYKDGYNFFLSQLRINIERAFGCLVHRWAILRGPLHIPINKVSPMISCLCRLHNFLIDENDTDILSIELSNASNILKSVGLSNALSGSNESAVRVTEGIPSDLLHGGEHSDDYGDRNSDSSGETPMDSMLEYCRVENMTRPRFGID